VGFARDFTDEASDDAFLVQRSTDPAEDKPGLPGIYVEIPPQRYAMYGGISAALLRRDSFELRFTPSGADAMGGNRAMLATFDLDGKRYREVRKALRFIFEGCRCYREMP
jgi:hypothetical protein